MQEYLSIKGIYENGNIHLLEKIDVEIEEKTELKILIPKKHKRGIPIKKFIKYGNYISIGGDSVKETEEFYND